MADDAAAATGGTKNAVAALLFLQSGMYVLDAYSTLNSSPWTAESFGGDPDKVRSLKEYVGHAMVYSTVYNVAAAVIAESPWPVIGAVVNNTYLVWLYWRASRRGAKTGSEGWGTGAPRGALTALQWNSAR